MSRRDGEGRLIVRDIRGHALDMEAMSFTHHYPSERVFGMRAQSGKLRHAGQLLVRGHSQRVVAKRSGLARATVGKLARTLLGARPGLSCACGRAFVHRGICGTRRLVTSYPKVIAYRARGHRATSDRVTVNAKARERRRRNLTRYKATATRLRLKHRDAVNARRRDRYAQRSAA